MLFFAAPAHAIAPTGAQRISLPTLDIEALHRTWEQTVLPGSNCVWQNYVVDPTRNGGTSRSGVRYFRSLRSALANAAQSTSVCGPTIRLERGRYDIGRVEIVKPTILRGGPGVVVVGTLVNVSSAPMWIQDVSFEDARFPGALVVAHRDADVTLIDVRVRRARGFGIVQYGGRLEAWALEVAATRRASTDAIARVDSFLPPQGAPSSAPTARRALSLGRHLADMFAQPERFGPGVHALVDALERANSEAWLPLAWSVLLHFPCLGSGQLVFGPTYVELHEATFGGNSAAGLTVRGFGALVAGEVLTTPLNGYGVSIAGPVQAIDSDVCLGGINVSDSGVLLVDGVGAFANNEVGVLADDGIVGIGNASLTSTQSTSGTWGDNATAVNDSFLAISDSQLSLSVRAGILYADSSGNLVSTTSTQNRFGLVIQSSSVYTNEFDASNNTEQNFLGDGDLPIPNEPLAVPEA